MKNKNVIFAGLVSLFVSACGGSSGGDSTPSVDADTSVIRNNAASAIGGSFDSNLTVVGRTFNQNSDVVVGTVGDVVVGGTDEFPQDVETDAFVQSTFQSLVSASLAAAEGSEGETTRSGNTILINPDDNELCADEALFGATSGDELANCVALVSDLTVELVASSEESGEVDYLFQNQSVLTLEYAPGNESVELNLSGLKTLIDAYTTIFGEGSADLDGIPAAMSGSLKLSTVTTNTIVGQEAGSVAFEVIEPINILALPDDQSGLTMEPGTLFAIAADAGTGEGSLFFDVGAIAAVVEDGSDLQRINLAGFTGRADVNPQNGTLVVSNLGLSRGPFSMSLNNQEVLRVTLETFGFEVSEQSGDITIDGDMNLSLLLDSRGDFDLEDSDVATAVISAMAPSGTSFKRAGNGALQIGGAGPFTISVDQTSVEGDFDQTLVTVNSGECLGDFSTDEADMPSAEQCL